MRFPFLFSLFIFALFAQRAFSLVCNDLSFHTKAKPGEEITVKMTLRNEQDAPETVLIKPSDYSFNANGETFFLEPGTLTRSNASWINLRTSRVVVPPNEHVDVYYTIRIPKDPLLKGSYWSVFLIEPQSAHPIPSEQTNLGLHLQIKVRYAYQVIVDLGDEEPKLKILTKEVLLNQEQKLLNVEVANIGSVFISPKLTLNVYNSEGKLIHRNDVKEQRIFPNTSITYNVDLNNLKSGSYIGFLLLEGGKDQIYGDRFNFKIP